MQSAFHAFILETGSISFECPCYD